ncbi:hypothetical protein EG347_14725 [Chryseobacterium sp. G0186]|nr:hypothetical protein EG347_14725 [Chryseobacterium sp. G0186]
MEGEVVRDGKSLGKKPYKSGGTKGKKNQYEALKTHTERKFIDDVVGDLVPGDHLKMSGELNPCRPGCQPAIRDVVYTQNVTAEYKATSTGKTYSWKKDGKLVYQTEVDIHGKARIFKYNMEAKKIRRVEVKAKHH